MNRKIVDLLVQVLQWIGEGQQDQADIQAMIEDLLQSGFEQSDIQMVLNWVQDRLSSAGLVYNAAPLSPRSQRVLHSMESTSIRPELLRFLMELKNRQLITAGEVESGLERALLISWQNRSLEELQDFVNHTLLGRDQLDTRLQHRFVPPHGVWSSH